MTVHRVDELLDRIEHATIATVSADGRPWNTPVYFARDRDFLYWSSRRDAEHSTNIRHNGLAFVVIFDSSRDDASGAGVDIEATAIELANHRHLHALAVERHHFGDDASAILGGGVEGADITQAYHAHMQRARNRRGGHRQHVNRLSHLLQSLFVSYAETLFFIDNE